MKCIDDIATLCLDPPFPSGFDAEISIPHSDIVKAVTDFKDGNITANDAIAKISSNIDSIVIACENKKKEYLNAVDGDFTKLDDEAVKKCKDYSAISDYVMKYYATAIAEYNNSVAGKSASITTEKKEPEVEMQDGGEVRLDFTPKAKPSKKKAKTAIEFGEDVSNKPIDKPEPEPLPEPKEEESLKGETIGNPVEVSESPIVTNDRIEEKQIGETVEAHNKALDGFKPVKIDAIPKPQIEEEIEIDEAKREDENSVGEVHTPAPVAEPAKPTSDVDDDFDIASDESKIVVSEDDEIEVDSEDDVAIDANGLISDGPIVNMDDDTDVGMLSEEELASIEIEKEPEEANAEAKDVSDGSDEIDGDKKLYETSKVISRKRENPTLAMLRKFDPKKFDLSKISVFDYDGSDEAFRKEYITSRDNMMAAPRVSRIALLMSGHYEEIAACGNFDFTSIGRVLTDGSIDFVDREVFLYNFIYSKIMYCSYARSVPEFDEWAQHIFYPDINSLFFGVYDANSVGENNYTAVCPKCGKTMVIPRENKDIAVAVSNVFKPNDLEKFIKFSDIMKQDISPMYEEAKNKTIRKQLNNTKYIVEYGVPTLFDYLTTISTLRKICQRDNIDIDLSNVETFAEPEVALRIFHYMYIKRIAIPSVTVKPDGKKSVKYVGLRSKADIIEFLNQLDINDYSQLVNARDISDFITKSACDFYLKDCKCTNETDGVKCDHVVKYLLFNPKKAFFFKIGEARANLG